MLLTIVVFLALLILLILTHEIGHFAAAKMSKVKVEEFGLGLPPRIWGYKYGETIYSINWIPFGGFTRLLGEEDPSTPGSLASKSIGARIFVLSAGSLLNILLPIILFTVSFMIPHDVTIENVLIKEVAAGSPAQTAGIEAGDRIVEVNGHTIKNRADLSYHIQLNLGNDTTMVVMKPDTSQKIVSVTPRWVPPQGQGATGVMLTASDTTTAVESMPFWQALPTSVVHSWEILVLFKNEVMSWFVRSTAPQLAGPIAIAQLTGEVIKAGISPLLEFTALISINLGIFNLLPIPGLDGGRLVFVLLEWVRRGKRISPQKEGLVHMIGFLAMILLILVISYFDVARIIRGESLLP
ncbi:MAG: M50 family metallopeptidase [Dehalococcoidia bacterium]|nr:M50 family metallopeptidase [Dehalococcoidia bacterium]MDD5648338.1 M50 family metallopeptidase [Dehalococcoidia bacterium]